MAIEELYSDRARAVLDNYFPFPEPKVPVTYNFDQGVPAPELYPLSDVEMYLGRAINAYGDLTCAYYGDAGYEEMTYGFAGLRETLAERSESPQLTAGKSVSFATAGMHARVAGALSPTMMAAVNTLEPGGVQRRHRHNSVAITVALRGRGTYSTIGAEKVLWEENLVMVTPPRLAHSHTNDGVEMMRSIVVQDGPLYYNTRSVGFEWTEETY